MLSSRLIIGPVSNAATQLLASESSKRYSITFLPPNAGSYTVNTENPVVLGSGFTISAAQGPVTLTIDQHGSCVQLAWFAISSAAGAIPAFIEALL